MRRFTLCLICGFLLLTLGGCLISRRSVTVVMPKDGLHVTYSVAWGWGMEERLTIAANEALFSNASTGWEEIWHKPYNSGMTLYRSEDGRFLYIGLSIRLYRYDVAAETLTAFCYSHAATGFTPLGERLAAVSFTRHEEIDPGSEDRLDYVDPALKGGVPSRPPGSRYYSGLEYLGRFGVIRAEGRGSNVGFEPADKAPEPRLGLGGTCG